MRPPLLSTGRTACYTKLETTSRGQKVKMDSTRNKRQISANEELVQRTVPEKTAGRNRSEMAQKNLTGFIGREDTALTTPILDHL